jgi:6-phosphogluconolactonase
VTDPSPIRWREFADADEFIASARAHVLDAAAEALKARGVFHIVLAGGATPRALYASLPGAVTDWSRWRIYFGDERCLPVDHPERNSRMAAEAWLDHVAMPPGNARVIPAELGPEDGARRYAEALAGIEAFDLVLLGLGEDGHTASLFPGADWSAADTWPDVLAVRGAPKPPAERVSLSPARLARSRGVLFLVAGSGKARALADWRAGLWLPAASVKPASGVDVYILGSARPADVSR